MSNEIEIRVKAVDQTSQGLAAADANLRKVGKGADQANTSLTATTAKASGLAASLKRVGEIAAGVLAADMLQAGAHRAKALIDSTVEAASSLGESINAVGKVFAESSTQVLKWGQDNANAIGLSTRAFNQAATPLGSMLKNQGLSMAEVTDHTIKLTQRAADLASVFNTDVMDALVAIQAGLRGEQDPLERYGVSLSAVAVEARALADSHKTSTSQLTSQEKALARLNIIYDQTKDSAGDFADTSTGLANAQRIATATIEDAKAKVGTAFIPVMAKAAELSGKFAEQMTKLPAPVLLTVAAVGGLAAGLLLLAPRIIATKAALAEMAASSNVATRALGTTAVAAGKVVGALAALQLAAQLVHSIVGQDLNPQIDVLAEGLADWAKTGELAGESARLLGDDAKMLDLALRNATSSGKGFSTWVEGVIPGAADADASWTKNVERIKALDSALAKLVGDNRGVEAAAVFGQIEQHAADAGISVDELKAIFPEYSAAVEAAAHKTGDLGKAASETAKSVNDLTTSFDKLFEKTFGLEEAQDKAADAVERLRQQIKQQKEDGDKGAGSLTGQTQAARDNRESVRGLVQTYEDLAVKMQAAGKDTKGVKKQLEDQLVALGFSRKEAQRYTSALGELSAALDALPDTVPVKIVVSTVQDWTAQRKDDRKPRVYGPRADNTTSSTGYTGHASGGIIGAEGATLVRVRAAAAGGQQGGWTMVGEQGPELARLPYGSTVYPHGQSMQMLGAAGGGTVRHVIDLRVNGRTIREISIDDAVARGVPAQDIRVAYP